MGGEKGTVKSKWLFKGCFSTSNLLFLKIWKEISAYLKMKLQWTVTILHRFFKACSRGAWNSNRIFCYTCSPFGGTKKKLERLRIKETFFVFVFGVFVCLFLFRIHLLIFHLKVNYLFKLPFLCTLLSEHEEFKKLISTEF